MDPVLYGSQQTVDAVVQDLACMFRVPRTFLNVVYLLSVRGQACAVSACPHLPAFAYPDH